MLGITERLNRNTLSMGSMAAAAVNAEKAVAAAGGGGRIEIIGEVPLVNFYNDGGRGTGTAQVSAVISFVMEALGFWAC